MKIRKAIINDSETLCKLYEGSLATMACYEPRQFRPAQPDMEFVQKGILQENGEIFVVEEDGAVVAMASAFLEDREERPYRFGYKYVVLDTLYVSEYHRGKGYASALFQTIKDWAKQNDVQNIQLMTLGGNKKARAFYEGLGMRESSVYYILEDF